MNIDHTPAVGQKLIGTLRYTAGKVTGDRGMQTQRGVEIAIRHHAVLAKLQDIAADTDTP